MACKDCIDKVNCTDPVSSTCVLWNGTIYDNLDMCINDTLTSVINKILAKVEDFMLGKSIVLEDLDLSDCTFIEDILDGEDQTLLNILDVYKQAQCQLKTSVDANTASIASFALNNLYTLGCIAISGDPCSGNIGFKNLIQAMIDKICALNTQLQGIAAGILDAVDEAAGNFLIGGAIVSCGNNGISYSGSGPTAKVTFQALVPPYSPILYTGSTAYFDTSGIGLANTVMCGWYLCNGNNGTPASSTLPQNTGGTLQYIIRFN